MSSSSDPSDLINTTTILALGAILFITAGTYILSLSLLPSSTPTRIRTLFLWQTFDFAIHFFIEAPFLYTCFFTSAPLSSLKPQTPPLYNPFFPNFSLGTPRSETPYFPATPPNVYFLGRKDHAHGAYYGTTWAAKLWQEYAKADKRWGGADLGVVSLEILTVGLMAPLGVWICVLLWRAGKAKLRADTVRAKALERSAWFWGLVVATGELYGGMFFPPLSRDRDGRDVFRKWPRRERSR